MYVVELYLSHLMQFANLGVTSSQSLDLWAVLKQQTIFHRFFATYESSPNLLGPCVGVVHSNG